MNARGEGDTGRENGVQKKDGRNKARRGATWSAPSYELSRIVKGRATRFTIAVGRGDKKKRKVNAFIMYLPPLCERRCTLAREK